jgi:hypothetical protein
VLTAGRTSKAQPKLTEARRFTFKCKEIGDLANIDAVDTAKKVARFSHTIIHPALYEDLNEKLPGLSDKLDNR